MTTTVVKDNVSTHGELQLATWAALAADETGDAAALVAAYADRSIQVTGTFGGATVELQGSNDGTTYFTLKDPFGNDLSFTAAGLKQVLEVTLFTRPKITGGAGTTIKAVLFARKSPAH